MLKEGLTRLPRNSQLQVVSHAHLNGEHIFSCDVTFLKLLEPSFDMYVCVCGIGRYGTTHICCKLVGTENLLPEGYNSESAVEDFYHSLRLNK